MTRGVARSVFLRYGRQVMVLVIALTGSPSHLLFAQQVGVVAAERALMFGNGLDRGSVRPSDESSVVLVLTVKGFSFDEWKTLSLGSFLVIADGAKFACRVRTIGTVAADGEHPDYRLVFVVPKAANKLSLQFKEQPPIDFQAITEVKAEVR